MSVTSRDWLLPPEQERGVRGSLHTLRERWWLIALAVVLTTGVAIAYVATAQKTYDAESDLLVTPVPAQSKLLTSLGLISPSSDPLVEIETIARLTATNEVAALAQQRLAGVPEADGSTQDLLDDVSAAPVANSNIVAVTASASTADDAAKIANTFVESAVDYSTRQLRARIADQIQNLQRSLALNPPNSTALAHQISQLTLIKSGKDPTIQVATRAQPPTSPASPKPVLSIAGGILAGLVLGIGGAFAYQALDPRLRREEQLRALFRLPILARVPTESRRRRKPIPPTEMSPGAVESYRALRASLGLGRALRGASRAVLVTSPSASEGKTTTAMNLAASLTMAGRNVILIEGDLRKPEIGSSLGIKTELGLVSVLLGEASLDSALVESDQLGPNLRILLAEETAAWTSEIFSLPTTQPMIEEAKSQADFVIIDSSPLSEVVDALPLASGVDQILLAVRLGRTRVGQLVELGELLHESNLKPAGFVVVGAPHVSSSYYAYGREAPRVLGNKAAEKPAAR